eukprot:12748162-Alexandrium_andersonii.AAC.1
MPCSRSSLGVNERVVRSPAALHECAESRDWRVVKQAHSKRRHRHQFPNNDQMSLQPGPSDGQSRHS